MYEMKIIHSLLQFPFSFIFTSTENLRFDAFCDDIRNIFGTDIRSQDLKAVFRKITTNPDAKVDWSEVKFSILTLLTLTPSRF